PIATPYEGLTRLSPAPDRLAGASVDDLGALGIIRTRGRSILAVAHEVATGRLRLEPGIEPDEVLAQLEALPGIGPWTAQYIGMRALRWPDAFPSQDIALRNSLGGVTARQAESLSRPWRPWRSYALLHLWQSPTTT